MKGPNNYIQMNKLKVYIIIIITIILTIPVLIIGTALIWFKLPYIYTPQALDSENYVVYKECVDLLKNCNRYKDIMWFRERIYDKNMFAYSGRVFTGDLCQTFADPTIKVESKLELLSKINAKGQTDSFQGDLEGRINKLSKKITAIRCARFYRHNDMILFYKTTSSLMYPTGPGVLYSLEGRNPNNVDSIILNSYKPFIKIDNNWYMSRHLMLQGPRFIMNHTSIPKSLFDHSLKTKGVRFL